MMLKNRMKSLTELHWRTCTLQEARELFNRIQEWKGSKNIWRNRLKLYPAQRKTLVYSLWILNRSKTKKYQTWWPRLSQTGARRSRLHSQLWVSQSYILRPYLKNNSSTHKHCSENHWKTKRPWAQQNTGPRVNSTAGFLSETHD